MSDLNQDYRQEQLNKELNRASDAHYAGEAQTLLQRQGDRLREQDLEISKKLQAQDREKELREKETKKAEAKRGFRYSITDLLSKARDSELVTTVLKALTLPVTTAAEAFHKGYKQGGYKFSFGNKKDEIKDEDLKFNNVPQEEERDVADAINENNYLDDGQSLSADGDLINIDDNLDLVNPEKADTGLHADLVTLPLDQKDLKENLDLNLPPDHTFIVCDSPELVIPDDLTKTPYIKDLDKFVDLNDDELAKAREDSDLFDGKVQDHLNDLREQEAKKTASADDMNDTQRKPNAETELASQSETVQGSALKSNPNRYVYAIPTKQAEQIQKLNEAGKITGIEVHKNLMSAMASNSNPNDITSLSQKQYEKLMKKKEALRLKELAKAKRAEKELKESMNVVLGGGRSR